MNPKPCPYCHRAHTSGRLSYLTRARLRDILRLRRLGWTLAGIAVFCPCLQAWLGFWLARVKLGFGFGLRGIKLYESQAQGHTPPEEARLDPCRHSSYPNILREPRGEFYGA